jgi:hypothetical protein
MIIFLLTLLVVSLAVIFVGYRLSPRPSHTPDRTRISYVGHAERIERAGRVERAGRYARAHRGYSDYGYGYGYRARQTRPVRASRGLEKHSEGHVLALMDVRGLFSARVQQTPWLGLALILVICCLTGVLVFKTLLPGTPVLINSWPDVAASTPPPTTSSTTTTKPAFAGVIGASNALTRINQLDPAQYSSQQEFDTWAYSTCSAASMTEIINSYDKYYHTGRQYRITDILKVESGLNEITPDEGLLRSTGIDHTVAQFNFQAQWLNNPSVDDLVRIGSSGRPIIIDFPPSRWDGGHILVVRGGNKNYVYLADSSRLNMQAMARQTFLKYWAGWAVAVTPKGR